jgi:glucokinase
MEKKGKNEKPSIGIDLGGTKMLAALVNREGVVLRETLHHSRTDKGSDAMMEDIINVVANLREGSKSGTAAIGIGTAGQITPDGMVRSAPNLPFENEPLQAKLEKELEMPVIITNDVHAAAYGEWKYGAGKGVDNLVVLFVGTGIGGGVVSGGKLLEGCTNSFGELGHITLVADGRKCRCPNYGCIEAYAGGWAIAERAQEAVAQNPAEGKMLRDLAGSVEDISAETLSKAWMQGDLLARKLVEETGEFLGAGAVGIVNAFNPCILVLGGGVIEGIPKLIPIVEDHIHRYALKPNQENVRVVKAGLGTEAGVIGAAAFAQSILGEEQ